MYDILGESVSSGTSTPVTPPSPNGSQTNSPRGGRGRGRPRGSRCRGLARGSPKQQNGTARALRLNSKQCPTTPDNVIDENKAEDSVEPGNYCIFMNLELIRVCQTQSEAIRGNQRQ